MKQSGNTIVRTRRERAPKALRLMGTTRQKAGPSSHATANGEGHVTQGSDDHQQQRACTCVDASRRLARRVRPSPLLRQFGLQRRRAHRRNPARPAPAITQRLRFLTEPLSGSERHSGARVSAQRNDSAQKRRGGIAPVAPRFFALAGPGLRAPRCQALGLSGRSQRGDSAWYKTLDHLLSLLMEASL
jgi:hypothetical protein